MSRVIGCQPLVENYFQHVCPTSGFTAVNTEADLLPAQAGCRSDTASHASLSTVISPLSITQRRVSEAKTRGGVLTLCCWLHYTELSVKLYGR